MQKIPSSCLKIEKEQIFFNKQSLSVDTWSALLGLKLANKRQELSQNRNLPAKCVLVAGVVDQSENVLDPAYAFAGLASLQWDVVVAMAC